jgi:signal peptidase I
MDEEGRAGSAGEHAEESTTRSSAARAPRWWENRLLNALVEFLVLGVIALIISVLAQSFLVKAFEIPSISMEPTLKVGDRILVDRLTYHFRKPHRGEIIVFRFNPAEPANHTQGSNPLSRSLDLVAEVVNVTHRESTPFIKRVIGLPGETVEVRADGYTYINGERLEEDYEVIKGGPQGTWQVGEGEVFVMGDNRPNSNDSRSWGCVPFEAILGRAVLVWWPKSRWRSLR